MQPKRKVRRTPIKQHSLGGVTVTIQKCSKPGYAALVVLRKDGRREDERYCKTITDAQTVFEQWTTNVGNTGAKATVNVSDADRRLLMDWKEKLALHSKTPTDAFAHYLAHLERCKTSITISALCDKFQALKTKEKKSRRYLDDLHYRLGSFAETFGERIAADVSTDEISAWLSDMNAAPQTKLNHRTIARSLFSYAVTLKACADNPVDKSFMPSKADTEVGILKVKEAAALLKAAHERPEILPAIAIGLFGGVRDAEIHRLDWSEINFESGFITISPAKAKKKSRRLVELRPALRSWLEPLRQLSGPLWPAGERGRILHEAAREAAGLTAWPHNALRHSFASYALAKWQNAAALALEMGNSAPVIMEHYRELVLPKDAENFWNLTPSTVLGDNIITDKSIPTPIMQKRITTTKAA
jgi:integrase